MQSAPTITDTPDFHVPQAEPKFDKVAALMTPR